MTILAEKEKCTGCGSCAISCPEKCILMDTDAQGFRYPTINNEKCIHCSLCEKKCPVITPEEVKSENIFLAAKNKNIEIRKQSTSGGVFTALAQYCINNGGIVCGAAYDSDNHVVHSLFSDEVHIAKMRSAKYSQSYSEHTFLEIREMLKNNRWVLFSGTPCQVAALRSYLGKDYNTLILVDIVCHGVPSPLIWDKYLADLNRNSEAKLKSINLRSKVSGWSRYNYSTEFVYENGKKIVIPQNENYFMRGFVSNLYLRPSCSHCSFKGVDRVSDFTLGDYWGIWNQYAEFDDNVGTSMIIIHGTKGRMLW